MNRFPPGYLFWASVFSLFVIDAGVSSLSGSPPFIHLALTRLLQIGFMAGVLFLYPQGAASLGLSGNRLGQGVRIGIIWSALMGGGVAVIAGLMYLAGNDPFSLIGSASYSGNPFLFLFTACFLSPIAEELFFRGFCYSYLRRFTRIPAIVLSSFLFAFCHLSSGSLPIIPFLGGLVFAAAFEYSKSLAAPLMIHILGNTAILILQYVGP